MRVSAPGSVPATQQQPVGTRTQQVLGHPGCRSAARAGRQFSAYRPKIVDIVKKRQFPYSSALVRPSAKRGVVPMTTPRSQNDSSSRQLWSVSSPAIATTQLAECRHGVPFHSLPPSAESSANHSEVPILRCGNAQRGTLPPRRAQRYDNVPTHAPLLVQYVLASQLVACVKIDLRAKSYSRQLPLRNEQPLSRAVE